MGLFGHHHHHHDEELDSASMDGATYLTDYTHENRALLWLHVSCMVIALGGMLPFGIALAIRRSPLHIPVQILATAIAVAGYVFGVWFSSSAPDLYPDNAHSSFGWWLALLLVAQVGIGAAKRVIHFKWIASKGSGYYALNMENRKSDAEASVHSDEKDTSAMLPSPTLSEHSESTLLSGGEAPQKNLSLEIESLVSTHHHSEDGEHDEGQSAPLLRVQEPAESFRQNSALRVFQILRTTHKIQGYSLLLFFYVQFLLGLITVTGTCIGETLGNCLAHYVKGSLFVGFGLLTFARYLGCWAQYGWAWNTPPARSLRSNRRTDERSGFLSRIQIPTFALIECSVVLAYGMTNTFLEHTGKDPNWNARDLQHASLAFMWWWGGALGVALESRWVQRRILGVRGPVANPTLPLILVATAYSIGGHHQHTAMSLAVHRQFAGFLLVAAMCRLITILRMHHADAESQKSNTRSAPPPTELICAFCLSAAGLTLAIANKSLIGLFDDRFDLDSNFVFNVVIAITSFLFLHFVALLGVARNH